MSLCELDSFILKFKNLWQAGRNANLVIKSNCGKAEAHLSVELGTAPVFQWKKSSPSRQRRCERRAAVRATANVAEEASKTHSIAEDARNGSCDTEDIVEMNPKNATEESSNFEEKILEKEKEMNRLAEALTKRDLEVCKLRSFYIENLEVNERMDAIGRENNNLKKENKALMERYGDIGKEPTNDDLDRDKDMYSCRICDFAGKSEAGLKVHIGKKHKSSL